MNGQHGPQRSQALAFLAALGILILSVGVISMLIRLRPEPDIIAPEAPKARPVHVLDIERGTFPIHVEVFGTAQSAKTLRLQAPIAGTVKALDDLWVGKFIEPKTPFFQIDTIKQDLAIGDIAAQLDELQIKKERLERESFVLSRRAETARALLETSAAAIQKQQDLLKIETQLFANKQELYSKETISYTEFLEGEASLRQAELRVLNAETDRNNRRDAIDQLELMIDENKKSLANIENEREILQLKREDLESDRSKAAIAVDFHAQIIELPIEKKQEVTPGTHLATVRSIDKSQVRVDVPDSYFRWLYTGDLLNQLDQQPTERISIALVIQGFDKHFDGAYIKAIGDRVNIPSRSLPILIERENPVGADGRAIPQDELKPGMYCRVRLELAQADDVFCVPYSAIQADGSLVIAKQGEDGAWVFDVLSEPELVHESRDCALMRLPTDITALRLVTDQMRAVEVGSPLSPVLPATYEQEAERI
ncbi:MAG: hypothetical protein KDK78_10460 [Chlamydiia bacterium]|nr:hypothetical protein [Chlamydiia bacterium]